MASRDGDHWFPRCPYPPSPLPLTPYAVRYLLALILLVGCARTEPASDAPETILAEAAAYLWSQQGEDGGWHSETHGLLRGGQAWTPFVLHALLAVPDSVYAPPPDGRDRALAFLSAHLTEEGVLGLADSLVLEYPNYATAYALRVFAEHGGPEQAVRVRQMAEYLSGQQFTEARGIDPERLAYGAWGFGEVGLAEGDVGHIDLSHSRRALQALRVAGALDSNAASGSDVFLRLLQKRPDETRLLPPGDVAAAPGVYDGGFYASPTVQGTNKGWVAEHGAYASYATATADGILALLAAGHPPNSAPVRDAHAWLRAHPSWTVPAGIPSDGPVPWDRVMVFYHIHARSEAYAALGDTTGHAEVTRLLAERQRPDGSFANPEGAPNKENDPLLATAMMVETLTRVLGPGR